MTPSGGATGARLRELAPHQRHLVHVHELPAPLPKNASFWPRLLDRTGVCASVGCALHCALAPLLLLSMPALGGIWAHPLTHLLIAGLVLPVAAFALQRGYREHARRWIVAIGGLGMLLVLLGAVWPFLPDSHAVLASDGSTTTCHECCPSIAVDEHTGAWSFRVPFASAITLLGGIALVTAHLGNLRRCATAHG